MSKVVMLECPNDEDWMKVKQRAFVTIGKTSVVPPSEEWKVKILEARHSPIRKLNFSFYIECPYWVSVHLCRHVHAQPYISTQRNDRQTNYDRNSARQDQTVCMIWDMNAEEFMVIANKRLCNKASKETQEVVKKMCELAIKRCPEFATQLVPMCVRERGCHEMKPCGNDQ